MKVRDLLQEAKEASKEGMDKFLDMVHGMVTKEQRTIDDILMMGWLPDGYEMQEKGGYSDEDIKVLSKIGRRPLEAAFKAKYGKPDQQVIDEIEKAEINKLPADVKKTLEFLNDRYSSSISPHDMDDGETGYNYYVASPQKLIISQGTHGLELGWREEGLKKNGQSFEQIKKFFKHFKVNPGKRPKHKRSAGPLYD